jgi:hypothetical protein
MKKFIIFSLIEDEALVRGIFKEFTSLKKETTI